MNTITVTMKKKSLLFILIGFFLIASCNKKKNVEAAIQEEDPSLINEKIEVSFILDGAAYTGIEGEINYLGNPTFFYDGGTHIHQSMAQYNLRSGVRLVLGLGTIISSKNKMTSDEFRSLHLKGNRLYDIITTVQNNTSVRIDFLDVYSNGWSTVNSQYIGSVYTENGFQPSNSYFVIDKYVTYIKSGKSCIKIKGRFGCLLYRERAGTSMWQTVTDGRFVAEIIND